MNYKEINFYSDGNLLKGRHYEANTENKKHKTILMCHGFAGIQDLFFPKYANEFVNSGFDVVTFDYAGFGESEGKTEIIPTNQIRNILHLILFLKRDEILSKNKLMLWGTSLGGSYVLQIASMLKEVSGVYAQITFANGIRNNTVGLNNEEIEKYLAQLENLKYKEIVSNKKLSMPLKKLLSDEQSKNFLEIYKDKFPSLMEVKLGLTTVCDINMICLDNSLKNVKIPTLLGVAKNDIVNSPEEMRYIYNNLNCEKKLLELDCGHYETYENENFEFSIKEQIEWFNKI